MNLVKIQKLVLVCVGAAVKRTMYQRKVDVDMLNAVKSVLADVSSVRLCSNEGLTLETSDTLYGVQHIHINLYTLTHRMNLVKTIFLCGCGNVVFFVITSYSVLDEKKKMRAQKTKQKTSTHKIHLS